MTTVGLLHTAHVHEETFGLMLAAADPEVRVISVVDDTLLPRVARHGLDDVGVIGAVADRVAQLVDADVVICTCSTIGGLAEFVGEAAGVNVVRVDRPMAERAVTIGRRIAVVATAESTVGPTTELLRAAAGAGDEHDIAVHVVDGAWELFEAGDLPGYHAAIATELPALAADVDVIVLAQASMAPAAELVEVGVPVLTSPRLAVEFALA